jgi:hypothetical protein
MALTDEPGVTAMRIAAVDRLKQQLDAGQVCPRDGPLGSHRRDSIEGHMIHYEYPRKTSRYQPDEQCLEASSVPATSATHPVYLGWLIWRRLKEWLYSRTKVNLMKVKSRSVRFQWTGRSG